MSKTITVITKLLVLIMIVAMVCSCQIQNSPTNDTTSTIPLGKPDETKLGPSGYDLCAVIVDNKNNLWFTQPLSGLIEKVSLANYTTIKYQTGGMAPSCDSITIGPDGNLWFAEYSGNKIGRLSSQNGNITEYNIPTANAYPANITVGSDGNLWFTEFS